MTSRTPTNKATSTEKSEELSQIHQDITNLTMQIQNLLLMQKFQRSRPDFGPTHPAEKVDVG